MRVGEAMGLVWSDVQPAELTVTRQLNRSGRRGELKTGRSARRIDLSAQLAAKLREHRIASPCSGDHDPVFVRRDGTPYSRSVVLRVIRNAADAAGLEGVKVDDEWIVPPLTCLQPPVRRRPPRAVATRPAGHHGSAHGSAGEHRTPFRDTGRPVECGSTAPF
jgi:hypothetical protein